MPKSNRKRTRKVRVAKPGNISHAHGYVHSALKGFDEPMSRAVTFSSKEEQMKRALHLDITNTVETGFGINNLPKFVSETVEYPIRGNVEWVTVVDNPSGRCQLGIKLKDQDERLIDFEHETFAAAVHQALYYAAMVVYVAGEQNSSVRHRDNNCKLALGYSITTREVIFKDKPAPLIPMLIEVCRKLRDGVKD